MQKTVMLDAEREIYLVQRLNERNIGIYSGVDVYFSMDFMGSSEFEWGARPLSLKHQRENKYFEFSPSVVQVTLGDKNYEAWYIGPPEHLEKIRDWFLLELQGGTKMKGSSFIRLAYKVQETK